jgi:hypothetical protein
MDMKDFRMGAPVPFARASKVRTVTDAVIYCAGATALHDVLAIRPAEVRTAIWESLTSSASISGR